MTIKIFIILNMSNSSSYSFKFYPLNQIYGYFSILIIFFKKNLIIILAIFIIVKIIIFIIQIIIFLILIIILNLHDSSLIESGCNVRPKNLGFGCNTRPESLCRSGYKVVSWKCDN